MTNKRQSINALFDQYLTQNGFYSFEGESGVRRVTQLVRDIGGYTSLNEFLADNPAACDALVEHVRTNLTIPEWREDLISLMNEEDSEQ